MTTLTLLTFNIRLGLDSSIETIGRTLAGQDADIIALQEVGRHWVMGDGTDQSARLADRLGYHYRYGPALFERDGKAQYGIALLSRLRFIAVRWMKLPRFDDEQRQLLAIQLRSGAWILNTHLSIKERDRHAQCGFLSQLLAGWPQPWVLLGDLNCEPGDVEFEQIARHGSLCGADRLPTYPTKSPQQRLDHILASPGWTVAEAARVLTTVQDSDHLPLRAALRLP